THLFGGSAGREGTAIQMGASLADNLQRWLRLDAPDRRLMIMAGISGGFGSIFGVPAAGFVFGMEVQSVGRIRYEGMIPCLVAAYVGDLVTRAWGATHTHYPTIANLEIAPLLLLKVALAGVIFGLTSILFVELTHGIKQLMRQISRWTPLYPVLGGLAVIGLTLLLGTRDYLGLSLPLIQQSVSGAGVASDAFLWKLIFTAITLGAGYLGGEVTPLFVIGSTLGYTLGHLFGIDPTFLASIGLVAVFAGASNTPLACAIMGIEIFGGGSPLYLFLGCTVAYLASGHRGIYVTQSIGSPKTHGIDVLADESLRALAMRRGGGWLPRLPGLLQPFGQTAVKTLMTQPAIAVRADLPLDQVVQHALANGVRALPVINAQNQVVGMITDSDLRRNGLPLNLSLLQKMTSVEQMALWPALSTQDAQRIMTQPAQTIQPTDSLATAIQRLSHHHLKRLPVINEVGQLSGLITRSDILRAIAYADQGRLLAQKEPFLWQARLSDIELEPATPITATTPVAAFLESLRANGQQRTLVTDAAGKMIGIISASDLLVGSNVAQRRAVLAALQDQPDPMDLLSTLHVTDLMTTPVITIAVDNLVTTAIRLLIQHQIKRLPVIAPDGQLLGLVGRERLFNALAADMPTSSAE
ncbi:MAG: chloride channel protein, partial [Chloroflexi bacterium]|nr:chloride channel protein [Chloroflexota bacterium]